MGVAFLSILLSLQSVGFTVFALRICRALTKYRPIIPTSKLAFDTDLPSVTVCIPARNEEHALAECLQRVISSTYEKLEIVVLDDSSSDNTSILIKSFAHAGVRFVRGSHLPDGWLGKNHALKELAEQANGSYILFMDVDTRLSPVAIEYIVRNSLARGTSMLSIIPRRNDPFRVSILFSPLKYYWELLRDRPESPAAASNAWFIKRSEARRIFSEEQESIKNAPLPEAAFASILKNTYSPLLGVKGFGVSYEKKWSSQVETSIRILYPMLGKKVFRSLAVSVGLASLTIPYIISLSSFWAYHPLLSTWSTALAILFSSLYTLYAQTFWSRGWLVAFIAWPYIILQEAILIIISAIQHKRGRILWKGRPVRSVRPNVRPNTR